MVALISDEVKRPIQGKFPVTELNSSNTDHKATFFQRTRMRNFLRILLTLSCWYSLDGPY